MHNLLVVQVYFLDGLGLNIILNEFFGKPERKLTSILNVAKLSKIINFKKC